MSIEKFNKAFGVFHWDTFDNTTILIGEADTISEAQQFVQEQYKGRLDSKGADRVDIVNRLGEVVDRKSVV